MRPIVLVEPILGGHHGWYLEWILEGLTSADVGAIVFTTARGAAHPSLKMLSSGRFRSVKVLATAPEPETASGMSLPASLLARRRNANALLRAVSAVSMTHHDAFFFFPFLDTLAYHIGLHPSVLEGIDWSGIFMSPTFHQHFPRSAKAAAKARIQGWLFGRLLHASGLRELFVIDPELPRYSMVRWGRDADRLQYMNDPIAAPEIHPKDDARRAFGLREEDVAILAYGSLSRRKGILSLLDAVTAQGFPPNIRVIVAGQPDSEIHRRLSMPDCTEAVERGSLIVQPGFLEPRQESLLFSASDFCWLGYVDFFQMSGVMVKALAYGLPVLATRVGVIGRFVERTRSGIFIDSLSAVDLGKALARLDRSNPFSDADRGALRKKAEEFYVHRASQPVISHLIAAARS